MRNVTWKGGVSDSDKIVGSSKTLWEICWNVRVLATDNIVDHISEGVGVGEGVGEVDAGVVGGGHADREEGCQGEEDYSQKEAEDAYYVEKVPALDHIETFYEDDA